MSGIDLLLDSALDYERTHQVVLYTLLEKSDLAEFLFGVHRNEPTEWEPERQLFDLGIKSDNSRVFLEIKMWGSPNKNQLKRQKEFLKAYNYRCGYVLLGTSWFEFDDLMLAKETDRHGIRLGYEQIIDALNRLIIAPAQRADVYELALAYRNALNEQFNKIKNAFNSESKNKLFYYSLYWRLKQELKDFNTAIYTVHNRGGPVYILNNQSWHKMRIFGVETDLLYEVVNDELCIKFYAKTNDNTIRRRIREAIRSAAHVVLDDQLELIDAGRLGDYMTACKVKHDFSVLADMDKSVEVFAIVGRSLALIEDKLREAE